MPTRERHPTDALVEDLVGLYTTNARRLEGIVRDGLARGLDPRRLGSMEQRVGDATLAYRERQAQQARSVLAELDRQTGQAGPFVVGRAYGSGLVQVDRTLERLDGARTGVRGTFGRVHVAAVEALAENLTASLTAATARVRSNVDLVFQRANVLDGALPGDGRVAGVRFLGRRADDPYRLLALQEVAAGAIGLDTRREVSEALARRLLTEGVTDAVTGFVDAGGRRWSIEAYSRMVARTTTREAMTAGTANRLLEHGVDLVRISSHSHSADECSPYDGSTFSLTGRTAGYRLLDKRPPFHPNCRHVLGPSGADLDAYEQELAETVVSQPPPAPADGPPLPLEPAHADVYGLLDPTSPPLPPFGGNAQARATEETAERLEAQRVQALIEADPGPDPEAFGQYLQAVELEDQGAVEAAAADRARRNRELNKLLGADLAKFIDRKWGQEAGVRDRLLAGELTVEEAEELAYEEFQRAESRSIIRQEAEASRSGYATAQIPCFVCGRFKRRPADVCDYCGDDPVSYGLDRASDEREFNRSYGYDY